MKEHRNVVLRLTPALKLRIALVLVLLVGLLLLTLFLGYGWGRADSRDAHKKNRTLMRDYNQHMVQREQQQQLMTQIEKSAEIDRLAAEQVQHELTALRIEVADLKRDVAFYRGLMAPGERDKGFQLHDIELKYLASQERYSFKMTLTNIGGKGRVIKGVLTLALDVIESGKTRRIEITETEGYSGVNPIKLRFRFFQQVEGSFLLPQEVMPQRLIIRSDVKDASGKPFEVSRSWSSLVGSV